MYCNKISANQTERSAQALALTVSANLRTGEIDERNRGRHRDLARAPADRSNRAKSYAVGTVSCCPPGNVRIAQII